MVEIKGDEVNIDWFWLSKMDLTTYVERGRVLRSEMRPNLHEIIERIEACRKCVPAPLVVLSAPRGIGKTQIAFALPFTVHYIGSKIEVCIHPDITRMLQPRLKAMVAADRLTIPLILSAWPDELLSHPSATAGYLYALLTSLNLHRPIQDVKPKSIMELREYVMSTSCEVVIFVDDESLDGIDRLFLREIIRLAGLVSVWTTNNIIFCGPCHHPIKRKPTLLGYVCCQFPPASADLRNEITTYPGLAALIKPSLTLPEQISTQNLVIIYYCIFMQ